MEQIDTYVKGKQNEHRVQHMFQIVFRRDCHRCTTLVSRQELVCGYLLRHRVPVDQLPVETGDMFQRDGKERVHQVFRASRCANADAERIV